MGTLSTLTSTPCSIHCVQWAPSLLSKSLCLITRRFLSATWTCSEYPSGDCHTVFETDVTALTRDATFNEICLYPANWAIPICNVPNSASFPPPVPCPPLPDANNICTPHQCPLHECRVRLLFLTRCIVHIPVLCSIFGNMEQEGGRAWPTVAYTQTQLILTMSQKPPIIIGIDRSR